MFYAKLALNILASVSMAQSPAASIAPSAKVTGEVPAPRAPSTPVKPRKSTRYLASTAATPRNRIVISRGQVIRDSRVQGRVALLGGISRIASGTEGTEESRNSENLGQNIVLGVNADVQGWKYFGAELDVYYGIAPKQETTSPASADFTGLGPSSITTSLQHYGGLLALKGQLPLGMLVPKLGLGYGIVGLKHTLAEEGFSSATDLKINSPFALVGFDFTPSPSLLFTVDYARSLGGSGNYAMSSDGLGSPSSELGRVLYDRIRVGGYWRFTPGFFGGSQFVRRFIETDFEGVGGSSPSGKEVLTQVLVIVGMEF